MSAEIFEWRALLSVFEFLDKYSTAQNSDSAISWKAAEYGKSGEFLNGQRHCIAEKTKPFSGEEVTAVSKFICINCPFHSQPETLLSHPIFAKCSVEVFKSRTVKAKLQWKWQISAQNKHPVHLVVHLLVARSVLYIHRPVLNPQDM